MTLEVIRFQDLVSANGITGVVPGLSPVTIELKGEDFSTVDFVEVNNIRSPSVVIVDSQTLWVQLPSDGPVDSIKILSTQFTRTAQASEIRYLVGDKTRASAGVRRLVQLFIKWLLQSPGSDIFNDARGGGVQSLIGLAASSKRMEGVTAGLTQAVSRTAQQIREMQLDVEGLTLEERLLEARMLNINVVQSVMTVHARIRVVSMTGEDALALFNL